MTKVHQEKANRALGLTERGDRRTVVETNSQKYKYEEEVQV